MRKLVVTENVTLDGVIEATGGWFNPAGDEGDVDYSDIEAKLREGMEAQDALVLGRKTFESLRGYWPKQIDDTTGITAHLNQVSKYVISRSLDEPEWKNTTVWDGDLVEEVKKLKVQPGQEIGITGSISVVQGLISAGLVDEYRLFVYPVTIGSGRRLFPDNITRLDLNLLEAKKFRSGIQFLRYEPKLKA